MSKIEYEEACDIYEIFEESGEKMIKPLFYLYETEDEGDECPGRRACFGMAYRLSDFVSLWQNAKDKTQYEMDESVYLEDLSQAEFDKAWETATENVIAKLDYENVSIDTPCGVYMA